MDQRLWLFVALVVLWGDSGVGAPWVPTRCMPIPQAMALCHDIGYTEMQLPNLLDHDTATEAVQQSVSWLPLLARECHPDARLFLCSLFAPVCLDRLIYPCRSLCEAVQASCEPIMTCYGYPWPAILHCGRFPAGHSLCVTAVSVRSRLGRPLPRASCRDCELQDARSSNEVLEALCASDFAVKVRLSRCNGSSFGLSDCNLDSGLEVLKAGPLPAVELAPILRRWLQLDTTCMHNLLRGRHAETYVLSREVQGHRLLVTSLRLEPRSQKSAVGGAQVAPSPVPRIGVNAGRAWDFVATASAAAIQTMSRPGWTYIKPSICCPSWILIDQPQEQPKQGINPSVINAKGPLPEL